MKNLKPLVALYKTYRGGEWFGLSLESVYKHCAGIVVVASDQPWTAARSAAPTATRRGTDSSQRTIGFLPENCLGPLSRFQDKHPDVKTVVLNPETRLNTEEQYKLGLSAIKSSFGTDHGVLIVDTDEVWEDTDLLVLRETMTNSPEALYFRSGIWTYLKSPLYRVFPQESARVVVGLAHPDLPTGKSRFSNLYSLAAKYQIKDVDCNFHHYGYVRLNEEEITSKLSNSTSQDVVPTVDDWKRKVWDALPMGTDLHPQIGFGSCWKGVEELTLSRTPRKILESDTFWAGLVYDKTAQFHALFTVNDPEWRQRVETLPPKECPPTTVPTKFSTALSRFVQNGLGKHLNQSTLELLIPRLRMSLRELIQLGVLAKYPPYNGSALEIGSGFGGSMAVLMLACPASASMIAVDPYVPYNEENVVLDKGVREGSEREFMETVSQVASAAKLAQRVTLCKKSSREAASQRSVPKNLDLLLIDGNHSYSHCKEDLDLWWPRVNQGGIVLVHDYASRFPGVIRAVQEFEQERGIRFQLPTLSTLAWIRKP